MRAAILGWGSLIWDRNPAFDRWNDGKWRLDGPVLKIEFSRISKSRGNALTLVIDPQFGVETRVAWCLSLRSDIGDAVADLHRREKANTRDIGFLLADDRAMLEGQPASQIADWARERKLDGVVWTKLTSNFLKVTTKPFSIAEAILHLKTLAPDARAQAAEYILRAPAFIETPLKAALRAAAWFPEDE